MKPEILIILPSREGFSPSHFGAISLCVQDFVRHSRYHSRCLVVGGVATETPFPGVAFRSVLEKRRWWRRRSNDYAHACLALLRAENPRLVEVHNRPNLARFLCRKWPGRIALHLHNDPQDMRAAKTAAERQWLLENCAAIYCVSGYIRDRFIEGLRGDTSKVQVVYNGLALPNPAALPSKKKQILFVGRLKPEKGALEFAEALALLLPKHPDWRGVFIGAMRHQPGAPLGPYDKKIRDALEPLGDQVEMRGFCNFEETMAATAESAIAVVPSTWHEAFGRTALEAMACGCVVVSSTRGGLNEVIGEGAIRLPEVTGRQIATEVEKLILRPDLWPDWQHKALTQAGRFSITASTERLDAIRTSLLEER